MSHFRYHERLFDLIGRDTTEIKGETKVETEEGGISPKISV